MSRIGNKPIEVPSQVTVDLVNGGAKVSGPKGTLEWSWRPEIAVEYDASARVITVSRSDNAAEIRALHGLTRAVLANMVEGVDKGFSRSLEIHGVGYTVKMQGRELHINAGYMGLGVGRPAQFMIPVPDGIEVEVTAQTGPGRFTISGTDKQRVGQFAADMRKLRPPEPYLGKGIRYANEQIRRKQGKAFASGG